MNQRHRIAAAAWLIVRDAHAAEDIFQNVVLKAMTREISFPTEGAVLSWAFITARREGVDWLRRHHNAPVSMDMAILEGMEQEWLSEAGSNSNARMEALRDCLEEMPEKSRGLLKMRYFEGYRCEEVAEKLGAGLNAVYKRLSRLHQGLRRCIEGRLNQPEVAQS